MRKRDAAALGFMFAVGVAAGSTGSVWWIAGAVVVASFAVGAVLAIIDDLVGP